MGDEEVEPGCAEKYCKEFARGRMERGGKALGGQLGCKLIVCTHMCAVKFVLRKRLKPIYMLSGRKQLKGQGPKH